jgi:hypothetical protein
MASRAVRVRVSLFEGAGLAEDGMAGAGVAGAVVAGAAAGLSRGGSAEALVGTLSLEHPRSSATTAPMSAPENIRERDMALGIDSRFRVAPPHTAAAGLKDKNDEAGPGVPARRLGRTPWTGHRADRVRY